MSDNPDAHFGREIYQLKIILWLLGKNPTYESGKPLPSFLGIEDENLGGTKNIDVTIRDINTNEASHALAGLVVMGAAWESVDVFYSLSLLLAASGRNFLSQLACERCYELISAGRRSLVAKSPTDQSLAENIASHSREYVIEHIDELKKKYKELRANADSWQAERNEYMLARLGKGMHPDTHADFWSEFHDNPEVPDFMTSYPRNNWYVPSYVIAAIATFVLGMITMVFVARYRRKRLVAQRVIE